MELHLFAVLRDDEPTSECANRDLNLSTTLVLPLWKLQNGSGSRISRAARIGWEDRSIAGETSEMWREVSVPTPSWGHSGEIRDSVDLVVRLHPRSTGNTSAHDN